MTKQKMMLPITCGKHLHAGYGVSSEHQCPWCEIERLNALLIIAERKAGLPHEPSPALRGGDNVVLHGIRDSDGIPFPDGTTAKVTASEPELEWSSFENCRFEGPAPAGYSAWNEWAAHPPYLNVTIRATVNR